MNNVFKIQKVEDIEFVDRFIKDGKECGKCTNCNIVSEIENHICMTHFNIDKTKLFTSIDEYKKYNDRIK